MAGTQRPAATPLSGDRGFWRRRQRHQTHVWSGVGMLGRRWNDEVRRHGRHAEWNDGDLRGHERQRIGGAAAGETSCVGCRTLVVLVVMVVTRSVRRSAIGLRVVHQAVGCGHAAVRMRPVYTHPDRATRRHAHLQRQDGDGEDVRVPTSSAHVCNRPDSSATGARRRDPVWPWLVTPISTLTQDCQESGCSGRSPRRSRFVRSGSVFSGARPRPTGQSRSSRFSRYRRPGRRSPARAGT